ncbi:MAG: hypothetical protein IKH63_05710 [Prevotella sp.]|nr:hypothetical protein [Prevotella sp.]
MAQRLRIPIYTTQLDAAISVCQRAEKDLKVAIDFIHKQTKTGDEEFMRQAWTYIALAMKSLEYKSKDLKELFSLNIES